MERYSRQMILQNIGTSGQDKLRYTSVLIVGVGGLGTPISVYLTGAGIGRIGIIDNDTVSLSNLHRQVLYQESEVGKSKVVVATERLHSLNNHVEIDTYDTRLTNDNAKDIINKYDIVIDGTDNPNARYLIDEACATLGKPYVYGAVKEYIGQVSVFNYNGAGRYSDLFPQKAGASQTYGLFGVLPAIVGSLEANEAIKIITGVGEVLTNKLFIINLLNLNTNIINIK